MAAFCLKRAAEEQKALYGPQVQAIIEQKMYVDDLLHSDEDRNRLVKDVLSVKECIGNRGFEPTSNDKQVIAETS